MRWDGAFGHVTALIRHEFPWSEKLLSACSDRKVIVSCWSLCQEHAPCALLAQIYRHYCMQICGPSAPGPGCQKTAYLWALGANRLKARSSGLNAWTKVLKMHIYLTNMSWGSLFLPVRGLSLWCTDSSEALIFKKENVFKIAVKLYFVPQKYILCILGNFWRGLCAFFLSKCHFCCSTPYIRMKIN